MPTRRLTCAASALCAAVLTAIAARAEDPAPPAGLKKIEEDRTAAYAGQLEAYLRKQLVDDYPERAAKAWNRDYSSVEAFLKSVEPNRKRWAGVLKPPALAATGPMKRTPHEPLADLGAEWLVAPLGPLTAEGLLVLPAHATREKPVPLVIAQHGIGSFPERTFGLLDDGGAYHSYARELVKAGFAVLAPMNLRSVERRNRLERLARLADTSLPGIELARLQRLLDEVLKEPRIDRERVGMWGVSLGGLATMFWMPLEPRIKAGVVCAWFNHRRNKMAVPDPRYSCFLETKEEHAFFQGWLTEFTDSDAACLICPRPILVQTGKEDRIAHWPQVVEEFEAAKAHYSKLGIAERIEMDLHDGGHEARVESGVRFLTRWLKEDGQGAGVSLRLELSVKEYDPAQPGGTITCTVENRSPAPLDVPAQYDGERLVLYGRAEGHPMACALWDRTRDKAQVPLVQVAPGKTRELFSFPLGQLLADQRETLREDFAAGKRVLVWDWQHHARPPHSPIYRFGGDAFLPSATFWAILETGGGKTESGKAVLQVKKQGE